MRLHADMPVVACLRLVHFRISFLVAVLGRGRRGDQRRVHNSAFAHRQAFVGEVAVDFIEDPARQLVLFQQAAELEQCCRASGADPCVRLTPTKLRTDWML